MIKKEIKSSSKWFVKIYHYAAVSLSLVPGLFPKFSVVLCTAEELGRSLGTRLTFAQWIKIVVSIPRELQTLRELSEQQKWCKINQSFLIFQPPAVKITCLCREEDVAGIDVNMGCPKEFSLKVHNNMTTCVLGDLLFRLTFSHVVHMHVIWKVILSGGQFGSRTKCSTGRVSLGLGLSVLSGGSVWLWDQVFYQKVSL